MPRRSIAPGKDIGLSIMLNVEKDEYYCTGTESVGFKVIWSVSVNKEVVRRYPGIDTPIFQTP